MRLTRARVAGSLGVGAVAIMLATATSAWAWCSPYHPAAGNVPASALTVSPTNAQAGQQVVVSGTNWSAQSGPTSVVLHWETESGAVLGAYPDFVENSFSLRVTLPKDSPGAHQLVAVFEPAFVYAVPVYLTPETATASASTASGSTVAGVSGAATAPSATAVKQGAAPATAAAPGEVAGLAIPTQAPSAAPAARTAAGHASAALTPAPKATEAAARPAPAATAAGQTAAPVAAHSLNSDLWAGLSDGRSHRPTGLLDAPAAAGTGPSTAAAAAAVALAGLLALGGGFVAAELGRRRVRVARRS